MGSTDLDYMCLDLEVTNRCNAGCDFCPRDRTPHEGTMRPEVFDQAFARVVEFRDVAAREFGITLSVSFCGLGETTLNRDLPEYVCRAAAADLHPRMCTNASLLTEELSRALIDAGLSEIFVNCGDLDDEYDRVYKVSFTRMRDNVVRFLALAGDRVLLTIVPVDHRDDPEYVERVKEYWRGLGVDNFFRSPMLNRAGTIDVEGMDFASYPQHAQARSLYDAMGVVPVCAAPFAFPFIGYDGRYYLCSSDWEKRTPLGDVFDDSLFSVLDAKLAHVSERTPICELCCHDPVNQLTARLRRIDLGQEAEKPKMLAAVLAARTGAVHELVHGARERGLTTNESPTARRRIPVTAT